MKAMMMFILSVCMLMAVNAEQAAKSLGYGTSYAEALKKAKKEDKMVMLIIVKEHCRYCEKLVKKTLVHPEVEIEAEAFVPVIMEQDSDLPEALSPKRVPMTFFIDPKTEKSVWEVIGFEESMEFVRSMEEAKTLQKELRKQH